VNGAAGWHREFRVRGTLDSGSFSFLRQFLRAGIHSGPRLRLLRSPCALVDGVFSLLTGTLADVLMSGRAGLTFVAGGGASAVRRWHHSRVFGVAVLSFATLGRGLGVSVVAGPGAQLCRDPWRLWWGRRDSHVDPG